MSFKKTNIRVQKSRRWILAALTLALVPFVGANAQEETIVDRQGSERVLVVFTYREPGICPACDQARPIASAAAKEYRVEFAYIDDAEGEKRAARARVDRFPTFEIVERSFDGMERTLKRWSGAFDLDRRLRRAVAEFGVRRRPKAPQPIPRPRPFRDPRERAPRPKPSPRPKPRPMIEASQIA